MTPTDWSGPVTNVVVDVETAPGSGDFAVDERLRADRIELRSGAEISRAWLSVCLDDGLDGCDARQRYLPDRRLIVRTDETEAADRRFLFDGYPTEQVSFRDGRPGRRRETYEIEAEGVYVRLARDVRCWIYGRRMRNGRILDGMAVDPGRFAGQSVHVPALLCVFNADRRGNRAAEPLSVVGADGVTRRIFPFTYDGDPDGRPWSLADAVRYLAWFHQLPEGPVAVGDLLDATEALAGLDPAGAASHRFSSILHRRLVQPAEDLDCEALNLVDALARVAETAGLHVSCLPYNVDGHCASGLTLWAPEDGARRTLPMAWGGRHADGSARYDVSLLTPGDVLRDNQVESLRLEWNDGALAAAAVVVGDVKRWEMTVPLWPGWRPEAGLDNVAPPDREQAKAQALTPDQVEFLGPDAELSAWYRKYHRDGSEHEQYRDVGRLWVLNEDGAFDPAEYNRNAPFDQYCPFDFSIVGGEEARERKAWTRRPRAMSAALTPGPDGASLGVYVEVSFNGGATWHPAVGSVKVLKDRGGVRFGISNLTAMTMPDGDWYDTNLWYAMVDQTFRVRATAVFESDARIVACRRSASGRIPLLWTPATMTYKPGAFRFHGRSGTVLEDGAADASEIEVDDGPAAESLCSMLLAEREAGLAEATATIPWLDDAFRIGDCIAGVSGRDVSFNGMLAGAGTGHPIWTITGKKYVLSQGRHETTLCMARRRPGPEGY